MNKLFGKVLCYFGWHQDRLAAIYEDRRIDKQVGQEHLWMCARCRRKDRWFVPSTFNVKK